MKQIRRFSEEYFRETARYCEQKLLSSEHDDGDVAQHVFSDGFNARMKDVFRLAGKPKGMTPRKVKLTLAVAVTLLGALLAALSVGAKREGLYQLVYDEQNYSYAVARFATEEEVQQQPPDGVDLVYLPTYIPDGFEVEETFYTVVFAVTDYKSDDLHFHLSQYALNTPITFDNSTISKEVKKINDFDVYFYIYGHEFLAMWSNDEYCFLLSGDIPLEEAEKIIESIEKTDIVPEP